MGRKLRISEPAPGWRQVGKEEGGERKEETNWPCEQPVWLKGARPTHCRAQDGAWGEAARAEPRSLYLLENEGFHSSDEGHKRMKHKHSRNSKPRGENPPHRTPALGWGEAGSQLPATTAPSASEAHLASLPSRVSLPGPPHASPLLAQRLGGHQSGTRVAGWSTGLRGGSQQAARTQQSLGTACLPCPRTF